MELKQGMLTGDVQGALPNGGMECEFCSSRGEAGGACACAELEAEYLTSNSDSLCSLQQAEAASGGLLFDTWLVNEFCELGHLLVPPPLLPPPSHATMFPPRMHDAWSYVSSAPPLRASACASELACRGLRTMCRPKRSPL
jgi:hypothetical protein